MRAWCGWGLVVSLCVAACGGARPAGEDAGGSAPDGGEPDAGQASCLPLGSTCDPFSTENSCPVGQVCLPDHNARGPTVCLPAASSPKREHEPCGGQECGPGLGCLNTSRLFLNYDFRCERLCPMGSRGQCGPDQTCSRLIEAGSCLQQCIPKAAHCDLFAQDCPSPGDKCTVATDVEAAEIYYAGCLPAGEEAENERCSSAGPFECQKGLVCVRLPDPDFPGSLLDPVCRRICNPTTGTPGCPAGQACTPFAPEINLGACE